MTDPITPPPKLVQQWCHEDGDEPKTSTRWFYSVCAKAAQWGADMELEACCEHLRDNQLGFVERPDGTKIHCAIYLHQSRRPEPPSLKEQAYEALDTYIYGEPDPKDKERTYNTIRRALEALPE